MSRVAATVLTAVHLPTCCCKNVMGCQQKAVGHHLDQEVQVRRAGEHLDNEYG